MTRLLSIAALIALPLLGQTPEARHWADHWADVYSLPRELVYAVIEVESGWNPMAVSRAGAVGLMQLMPDTAATFAVRNRFDVAENTRGGVAYLAWLRNYFGDDWRLVVASYNAGHTAILQRGLNYGSDEVRSYVERVAYLYRRNRWETLLLLKGRDTR
jgi:soluble lytic murein transglycosylase-like protein